MAWQSATASMDATTRSTCGSRPMALTAASTPDAATSRPGAARAMPDDASTASSCDARASICDGAAAASAPGADMASSPSSRFVSNVASSLDSDTSPAAAASRASPSSTRSVAMTMCAGWTVPARPRSSAARPVDGWRSASSANGVDENSPVPSPRPAPTSAVTPSAEPRLAVAAWAACADHTTDAAPPAAEDTPMDRRADTSACSGSATPGYSAARTTAGAIAMCVSTISAACAASDRA